MATRRVVGGYFDGGFSFRTSLPGFDARYDDPNDPNKISFNTDWTNIVYVEKAGYVNPPSPWPSNPKPQPGIPVQIDALFFPDGEANPWLINVAHGLGYRPYVEARPVYSGGIIYDDYRSQAYANNGSNREEGQHVCGEKAWSFPTLAKISTWEKSVYSFSGTTLNQSQYGHRVAYVIYRLPLE